MASEIVIVDYGMGNLNSVLRAFNRMKVNCIVSSDADVIQNSHKIIMPGVGHFQKAMQNLKALDLIGVLNEAALGQQKPILGICLGMQLMTRHSEEGHCDGLGWFDADLTRFVTSNPLKYKIPHMGWNQISIEKPSSLMKDIADKSEFYFVHSYHLRVADAGDILNQTDYEELFPSAIEKDNLFGVQYHPEKSHDAGAQLLRNFVNL